MQPGTKIGLAIIGAGTAGLLLVGIIAIAIANSQRGEPAAPQRRANAPAPHPTRQPAPRPRVSPSPEDADGIAVQGVAGAAVIFGVSMGVFLVLILSLIVVQILILVWVVKDARARGADGGVWLLVILLAPFLGLLIYLLSRPPGMLLPCSHCGQRRLHYLAVCPVCAQKD